MKISLKYPPCGRLCIKETCKGKRKGFCPGCVETEGKPPIDWKLDVPKEYQGVKVCPIWECAEKHKIEHCGQCQKFPCKIFLGWHDPKNGKKSALPYIGLLLIREKLGENEWIKWIKIHKKSNVKEK